jgi:4-alpha-glucanotransferase
MGARRSGILLHITSLPTPYGVGDLGPQARRFARLLASSGQSLWQILPLNPTDPALGNSPYSSSSAFAGNKLLISPDLLAEQGFLRPEDLEARPSFPEGRVDYTLALDFKESLFQKVCQRYKANGLPKSEMDLDFRRFCSQNAHWLEDFSLFLALKSHYKGKAWSHWPSELKRRDDGALADMRGRLVAAVEREKLLQYLFFEQWFSLKDCCNRVGVKIIGDLPFCVAYDSADLWSHPEIFKLDEEGRPKVVSGVPPDYFSPTGQRWGGPVYDWKVLGKTGYLWWIRRLEQSLRLFDLFRIDHFRGLVAQWEIPAASKTASDGQWVPAPAEDFFLIIQRSFLCLPMVAEDLGYITPDVREIMSRFEIPGMKVLLFAFGEDMPKSPHATFRYHRSCVVYTATHDTNTVRGWFQEEASIQDKRRLWRYLGRRVAPEEVSWELIRLAMSSVADMAVIPMQDLLNLGEEARMNLPGESRGNYQWRLLSLQMEQLDSRLKDMAEAYGRG